MKPLPLSLFLALCFLSIGQTTQNAILLDLPFVGVLFQAGQATPDLLESLSFGVGQPVESLWQASEETVIGLETALKLELAAKNDYYPKEVLEHYDEFKRQYIGVVVQDKNLIFATFDRCTELSLKELTAAFIPFLPMDGGSCFMEILFDPAMNEFIRLYIHGEA
jgi:hypothetical protein